MLERLLWNLKTWHLLHGMTTRHRKIFMKNLVQYQCFWKFAWFVVFRWQPITCLKTVILCKTFWKQLNIQIVDLLNNWNIRPEVMFTTHGELIIWQYLFAPRRQQNFPYCTMRPIQNLVKHLSPIFCGKWVSDF